MADPSTPPPLPCVTSFKHKPNFFKYFSESLQILWHSIESHCTYWELKNTKLKINFYSSTGEFNFNRLKYFTIQYFTIQIYPHSNRVYPRALVFFGHRSPWTIVVKFEHCGLTPCNCHGYKSCMSCYSAINKLGSSHFSFYFELQNMSIWGV